MRPESPQTLLALTLWVALCLLSTPTWAQAPAGTAPKLTWQAALTEAESTSPLIKAARAGLLAFESKLQEAQWAWAPKVTLNTGIAPVPTITGNALNSAVNNDVWGIFATADVQLVQPLYTFGKIGALKRAARHGVSIGRALVVTAKLELRTRLAQAWNGVLLANELEAILNDGKKWLKRATRRMEKLRDEDSDDYHQNEHLRLRTRHSEFYAMEAENNQLRVRSEHGLRLLLGRPAGKPVHLAALELTPVAIRLAPVERYWALAQQKNPALRVARLSARAKGALGDAARAKLWPDVVLLGDASIAFSDVVEDQRSSFAADPFNSRGAGALLGLRWNLDVASHLARSSQADAHAIRARHQAELKADLLELDIRSLHQSITDGARLIAIYADSKKAAQGWLLSAWELYDDGFGDFRMVMEALVQFYGKKVAYLRTVFEHNVAVAEFSRALGADVTTLAAQAPRSTSTPGVSK